MSVYMIPRRMIRADLEKQRRGKLRRAMVVALLVGVGFWSANFAIWLALAQNRRGRFDWSAFPGLYSYSLCGGLIVAATLWLCLRHRINASCRALLSEFDAFETHIATLRRVCPAPGCGETNAQGSRYCRRCGSALPLYDDGPVGFISTEGLWIQTSDAVGRSADRTISPTI